MHQENISRGLLPGGIFIAAGIVRFLSLTTKTVWYDELYTVWTTHLPWKSVIGEAAASGHPPLYYLMGAVWFSLGSGEVWVRLLSWASGIATVALVYLIGKELFGRRAGIWAAALTSVSPVLIWYSSDATSYSWLVFLAAASLYMLIRSARRGGWINWCGYVILSGALCLTYFMFPLFLMAGWPFFWLVRRPGKGDWAWWLGSQAALAGGAAAFIFIARANLASGWLVVIWPKLQMLADGLLQAPVSLLAGAWISYDLTYDGVVHGLSYNQAMILIYGAVCLGIAAVFFSRATRKGLANRKVAGLALMTLFLIIAPVIAEAVMDRLPTARYYLWAAPLLLLLAGAAIAAAPRRTGMIAGSLALAASLALSVSEIGFNDNKVGDWGALTQVIAANSRPGDLLYCFSINGCTVAASFYLPQHPEISGGTPSLDNDAVYFASPGTSWDGYRSGYFTGTGMQAHTGAALSQRISQDLAACRRVWLVVADSTYGRVESDTQVMAVMEQQGWQQTGEWNFPPDDLRLYVRK